MVTITVGAPTHAVSDRLYGVFFEDINHGADGGLNANMVNNYSFDGVYLSHSSLRLKGAERWMTQADPLRFWRFRRLDAVSCGTRTRGDHGQQIDTDCPAPPIHANSRYVRVTVEPGIVGTIDNLGYNGGGDHANVCAMAVRSGHAYEFSACVRPVSGMVSLRVVVLDDDDELLTDDVRFDVDRFAGEPLRDGWVFVQHTLAGLRDGYGKLHVDVQLADRPGAPYAAQMLDAESGTTTTHATEPSAATFDIDAVSLMDADYWGRNDPKWRFGKLRRDLVETIAALQPAFVRFPGGCIVEGVTPGNEYRWKDTVGAPTARRQQYNMWAFKSPDGSSYSQSYQIGFYEYFCLCEDLHAKPLPTLFAGITCQSPYRDPKHVDTNGDWFRSVVVQDYLDLIDFANGNPDTSDWAAVRRDMGHPEPFGLDMIGIGNENFGADYVAKFDAIARAIHEKDPNMLCVMSAGLFPFRLPMKRAWDHAHAVAAGNVPGVAREIDANDADLLPATRILVDEHSYHSPDWFIAQASRFDDYRRDGTGVYFGEYSANGYFAAQPQDHDHASTWRSALAEAAFLTGCERNSDIVKMTSYAPLLSHVTGHGWEQNLIEFNPAQVGPSVNYEAERLFSANVGALAYECRLDGETPDGLYVSATGDEGALRFVKLVNTGGERVGVTLNVSYGPRGLLRRDHAAGSPRTLRVETLSGDPDARNELEFEGGPRDCLTRTIRESMLPPDGAGSIALALPSYSVTLVRLA
ncbi:alpha-L-arabinofuranosidase C-terminal domain-containing protein [Bifidobacterium biavatii]|uniref:non-reducing end alpha-L-arabinofuranosidase n=1 Tax=Bifidobacterium biavatii DSM 23969 TaxID=1437608 RepID=A0A087A0Z2_9BIFI|nr:alpha-L-arabinofuranosidase C-terminal domain-containing protein [Bifidobacterium biavatii]KFI52442.1 alpha-L-arabinofuranosidase A-like protein [Bifidobacterium biavatii DSM 23969]